VERAATKRLIRAVMISMLNILTFKIMFIRYDLLHNQTNVLQTFMYRISWSQSSGDYQNHHSNEKHFSSLEPNFRGLVVFAILLH